MKPQTFPAYFLPEFLPTKPLLFSRIRIKVRLLMIAMKVFNNFTPGVHPIDIPLMLQKLLLLYYSNSAPPNNLGDVAINGTQLEKRSSVEFLGVVIDEKLEFNLHVNKIACKISKNSGILYIFLPADSLNNFLHELMFCI